MGEESASRTGAPAIPHSAPQSRGRWFRRRLVFTQVFHDHVRNVLYAYFSYVIMEYLYEDQPCGETSDPGLVGR
ncbi:MAG: hypothetical protein WAL12_12635, partial [Trebonia sp.]